MSVIWNSRITGLHRRKDQKEDSEEERVDEDQCSEGSWLRIWWPGQCVGRTGLPASKAGQLAVFNVTRGMATFRALCSYSPFGDFHFAGS